MMTKTPHDSLILNSCKNVQLKTERGGYVRMQPRVTGRLAPPGGAPTLAEAAGAEDFPLEAK